ncbi:uncharacterized protein LOC124939370 [Impatiens glandulifera]|uniref:uncharacterized protein LOC124939370 n=1 Tax=Impatiens glandulifera TaxID=253017 RepID=UPI001FB1547F|nr:uncharacterized protein LOC124939370 [Impatiens glandulifera]
MNQSSFGSPSSNLFVNLRNLRKFLKSWFVRDRALFCAKINDLYNEINVVDEDEEIRELSAKEVNSRIHIVSKLLDMCKESLFAIGYPILASVRSMENNSNNDMRKLVAYWILFFLFSLFEHVLAKIIQWIPFWFCIKLGTVCWLVLPQFEQAYFVYSHHIQPILFEILSFINNYLKKSIKMVLLNKAIFLAMAEEFLEVNGSEGLEDLIVRKFLHDERKPNVENEALNVEGFGTIVQDIVTLIEEQERALLEYNNHDEKDVAQISKSVEKHDIDEGPKEVYSCGICQVKTSSEITLNSHFQGKKHKAVLAEMFRLEKKELSCSLCKVGCSSKASIEGKKHDIDEGGHKEGKKHDIDEGGHKEVYSCGLCQVKTSSEMTLKSHFQGMKHKVALTEVFKLEKKELSCSLCNVWCSSKASIQAHLRGKSIWT